VVAANQAFHRGLEPHEGEAVGRFCRDVTARKWPCAADQAEGCPVQRVFRSGQLHKGIVSCSGPDGVERSIEIHASPLRDAAGAVSHAVEVRRDISERRQLEGILAHSERLASLGLLASGLSHEINNPLGAIATSVEGLRRRLPGEPGLTADARRSLEEVLRRIAGEVDRGRTITHRLLKVARPPGTVRSLFDVNHVVHDIVAILAHDMKRSGIVANLQLGDSLPPLSSDESSLGQVVMNLALNSIQAMGDNGGTLRIATAAVDGMVQLEVEDSGSGIPPGLLKRIYEPFFTTKPVGSGTGLGLFITHRIVTEMGGDIQVRSQPGRGTVFTVRIPRSRTRREA
jgi:signal transduction histidine kinase